jgi:ParB-like chromosome segregation protein Spo0J
VNVVNMPLSELLPAPYNPRKVPAAKSPAYRKLRLSLETFGLIEPLVWNRTTGYLVGGHLRRRIWEDLGHTHAPVNVVELPAERERALNIILNNREAQGTFDAPKLRDLLVELAELPEFAATGFERSDLAALQFEPPADFEPAAEADRVEITLITDAAGFGQLEPLLDGLVRRFRLESHVRRG